MNPQTLTARIARLTRAQNRYNRIALAGRYAWSYREASERANTVEQQIIDLSARLRRMERAAVPASA